MSLIGQKSMGVVSQVKAGSRNRCENRSLDAEEHGHAELSASRQSLARANERTLGHLERWPRAADVRRRLLARH